MKFALKLLLILMLSMSCAYADDSNFFGGEWYFSWGYSKDYWANSNIHVNQNALGNNFTVNNVAAIDDPQWTHGGFGFVSQYNIRIGRFVDTAHTWAIELNLDHTKYASIPNQTAYVTGIVNGNRVNSPLVLTPTNFTYLLHNGLNHVMLNAVKRIPLIGIPKDTMSVAGLLKFGAGVLLPHSENVIFGYRNDVGPKSLSNSFGWNHGWWQMGGWTVGIEAGVRVVLYKPIYIEVTDKEAFAKVSNIPVFEGRANQNLWMNEVIFSLGIST